jgi:predicted DNA-binding protein
MVPDGKMTESALIRMTPELRRKLQRLAAMESRSLAEFIRLRMEEYAEKYESAPIDFSLTIRGDLDVLTTKLNPCRSPWSSVNAAFERFVRGMNLDKFDLELAKLMDEMVTQETLESDQKLNQGLAKLLEIPEEPFTSDMKYANKAIKAAEAMGCSVHVKKHADGGWSVDGSYKGTAKTADPNEKHEVPVVVCRMIFMLMRGA